MRLVTAPPCVHSDGEVEAKTPLGGSAKPGALAYQGPSGRRSDRSRRKENRHEADHESSDGGSCAPDARHGGGVCRDHQLRGRTLSGYQQAGHALRHPGLRRDKRQGSLRHHLRQGRSDTLRGDFNSNPAAVEGNDKVVAGAGDDFLLGEGGNDLLNGNDGNDSIDAKDPSSNSADTSNGGRGRDEIESTDRERDTVDCGPGNRDTVRYDRRFDTVKNCERKFPFPE